ncbi:MAG: hypothetical protein SFV53_06840 [Rickettsiales bacterium]|nr:hypothetical protein [Rickettsiales bacterium]
MKKTKLQNKILLVVFIAIILLPTLDSVFDFSPVKELFEKRKAITPPQLPQSLYQLTRYPQEFENFFNDNYGLRKSLIALHSAMMDKIFNESPSARVAIGKNDWFYFDNYNSLLDAQGKATISDELINRGVEHFYQNWQMVKNNGMDYLLIIAADKASIYPEFLPDYIKAASPHRIDKFLNALKAKYPDFPVLDLRPILLKAKEKEIVYQQTDTHWNRRGSHSAYIEIMKMLAKKDRRFVANPRSKFKDIANEYIRGDISDIMGTDNKNLNYELEPKFKETIYSISPTDEEKKKFHNVTIFANDNKNLPRLFAYQDSYFGDLFRFVSQHFSYAFYTNQYPCDVNLENIKKYQPNVVIQEFWEGRVEVVLKSCGSKN